MNSKELQERVNTVKTFLNGELTKIKVNNGKATFSRNEVGNHLDSIYEIERTGYRQLSESNSIKIQRLLTSVEARMQLSKN